jgi:hypothetical protein
VIVDAATATGFPSTLDITSLAVSGAGGATNTLPSTGLRWSTVPRATVGSPAIL